MTSLNNRVSVNGEPQGYDDFNFNTYATKKTIAKGLFNIGLLMSNASQLKAVITLGSGDTFFYPIIGLIALSIVLQLIVAVLLYLVGKNAGKTSTDRKRATTLNDVTVALVAVITVINIFISAFGMKLSST